MSECGIAERVPRLLGPLTEIEERVWLIDAPGGHPEETCRALSLAVPAGTWWVHSGCYYHQQGRRMSYYLHPERFRDLLVARSVAEAILGEPVGWSFTRINNALLQWAAAPLPTGRSLPEHLVPPLDWGFNAYLPGRHGWRRLVDVTSAYHQLLRRLPSPRLLWEAGRQPFWSLLDSGERARWNALLDATEPHKPFRLTLHGTMLGTIRPQASYRRGERFERKGASGQYRAAAALIVRSLYELVGLEAVRTGTEFAATDCLLLRAGEHPELWEGVGLEWSVRGEGEAHVKSPGCYKVGERRTLDYEQAPEWPDTAITARYSPLPKRHVYRTWL